MICSTSCSFSCCTPPQKNCRPWIGYSPRLSQQNRCSFRQENIHRFRVSTTQRRNYWTDIIWWHYHRESSWIHLQDINPRCWRISGIQKVISESSPYIGIYPKYRIRIWVFHLFGTSQRRNVDTVWQVPSCTYLWLSKPETDGRII